MILYPKGITRFVHAVYNEPLIIINLQATVLDRVYLSHRGCLAVCLNYNCCIITTMSSDKTTRARRRNLVQKHSYNNYKGYRHKPKTAYQRDSKAVRREIDLTLVDGTKGS